MTKLPNIKILVLNWNGENIVEECLSSLQSIDYNDFSIDIIDNGSSDNSISVIEQYFPDITIHKIDKNLGYSKGYNLIFKKLKNDPFEYYLLLNNDVTVDKNILNALVQKQKEFGDNHIYGPKIYYSNNKSKLWYAGGYINKFLGISHHIGINKFEKNIKYKTIQTNYISGCCMLIKKELINNLNGFNEIFKMYYEDVDLCYRASKLSVKCFVVDNAIIYHKVSYSIGNNTLRKIITKLISQFKFIYNHNNFILFVLSLFFNVILLPFSFILYIIKK